MHRHDSFPTLTEHGSPKRDKKKSVMTYHTEWGSFKQRIASQPWFFRALP